MTQSPTPGEPHLIEDGLACVLAPNPSPMTYWGTNTYLLGEDSLAVIDPGPADPTHLSALVKAIKDRPVSHILVTHSHLDHSPLAPILAAETGAPVYAFGNSTAGRSLVMEGLAQSGEIGGGEGVDVAFAPDEVLSDGDVLAGDGWALTARHTPGHFSNHLSFLWGDAAFTGDHLMGWATTLISPPDGDLTAFMASCALLQSTSMTRAYPGHGAPLPDAQARLSDLIAHRRSRESEIRSALTDTPATPASLTAAIYTDLPAPLRPMAERNVLAHLIDLTNRGLAAPEGPLSATAIFHATKS